MFKGAVARIRATGITVLYLFALSIGLLHPLHASADALISYSGSDVTGTVEQEISLAGITVSGTDPTIPLVLDVSDTSGVLYMTDTTGLTFTGSDRASRLSFSGTVADINAALATLKYRTLSSGTWTLTATIIGEGLVYYPGNGHLYEVVDNGASLSWLDAQPLAAARTLEGAQGYLATVTSQSEYDFISERLTGDGWFGASDAATENDWKWVTGPEAGTSFWSGRGDGVAVSGRFSHWASGEPNDFGPGEDCAQFYSGGGGWNDLPCDGDYLSRYVVEYGSTGDLPTAPENITFDITVNNPPSNVITIGSCTDLINVYNNGTDNRYDTLLFTTDVDCTGETLHPMFGESDTDFGVIGFRGELDGNDKSLTNVTISQLSDDNVGLFAKTNQASIHNLDVTGSVEGHQCVGGIAGTARDTDFVNLHSSIDVLGTSSVGGFVGCYEASMTHSNSISHTTSTGDITGEEVVGGFAGYFTSADTSITTNTATDFSGTLTVTGYSAGGILGRAELSDSSRLRFDGGDVANISTSADDVGALAGYLYINSSAHFELLGVGMVHDVTGDSYVGGLFGEIDNDGPVTQLTFSNLNLSQNVSAGYSVGGIVGNTSHVGFDNVRYNGTVESDSGYAGGLVGEAYNSSFTESLSDGSQTANSSYYLGGLVGYSEGSTYTRSFSTQSIDASSGEDVGGLIGYSYGDTLVDVYARGTVGGGSYAGGLIGYCSNTDITNAYATGAVSAEGQIGGLIGYDDSCTSTDSFWDTETSTQATSEGSETGKTNEELKNIATFIDTDSTGLDTPWDFTDVWSITAAVNDGYPCFQWHDAMCVSLAAENSSTDDTDGISSDIESAAPNDGDANDDGIPDSTQNNVSSFLNDQTEDYTVIETDAACALSSVSAAAESDKTVKDSGYDYVSGLIQFSANCGTPGYKTTVRIFVYGADLGDLVLRKYNPNTNAYFTITTATLSSATIGGKQAVVATYELEDGGSLDTDGEQNGVIVDPVGIAAQAVGVPNTGFKR